ncbi:hypothetical protein ABB37_09033 [Leptomonas pyrrhocoris]|uniref:Uncharacterized protein n=1 Tax=Leptomonas pyrrhocoris TaxID=157538 RepID=A0A0N0VD57_LEPPY|nr:hypothetical protein ABB37_09033 [Leptomonas pyrrhocoris]KPA74721.1 hypothetical protein ABB37_09033 [Leptomonas pyrrhocoris]|eukprot:XP_015653160.1 hypothetical protein ABB37_09033 [Leptomonas pyrrhocoris]
MTSRRTSARASAGSKRGRSSSGNSSYTVKNDSSSPVTATTASTPSSPRHQRRDDTHNVTAAIRTSDALRTLKQQNAKATEYSQRKLVTAEAHEYTTASNEPTPLSAGEDDTEEDAFQRFSNTSTHPGRTHKRSDSPPVLSLIPPPSPPRAMEDRRNGDHHLRPHRREYMATESGFYVSVSPPATVSASASVSPPPPPPSLLSELLLAEAERAGAAAAAAAATHMDPLHIGVEDPSMLSHRPASLHARDGVPSPPLLHSSYADQGSPTRFVSPLSKPSDALRPLAIQIGVVPLPRSARTSTSASGAEDVLPWMSVLRDRATAAISATASAEAVHARPVRNTGSHTPAEAGVEGDSIRFLRPRRLLTRSETAMDTATSGVVGWAGLLVEVPLCLPGSQPSSSRTPAAETDEVVAGCRGEGDFARDGPMYLAAATVMLMLT